MEGNETDKGELQQPSQHPSFLEVTCKSSGKVRRFAAGTEAGFALYLINRKLGREAPPALHIEAVKEGEEPVSFGPNSVLVDYGEGWKLQTVPKGYEEDRSEQSAALFLTVTKSANFQHARIPSNSGSGLKISSIYMGKIILAFSFIFLLGGTFTLILENLPRMILFITSL
eukprot:TRINITY_DN6254_c0_g1_i7.p1 TRINITY_DN6254_c0_g1~~TRINITY_DN6254_c0_g1_i7.p1  ORF type:complete len:171 (-),score=34.40 TRINITY_DN6254_c0_g1_i7:47-559(-)